MESILPAQDFPFHPAKRKKAKWPSNKFFLHQVRLGQQKAKQNLADVQSS